MARTAKNPNTAPKLGGVRPIFLAGGIALFWAVQYQDFNGDADAPMWADMAIVGARLLVDFVGAWLAITAVQLAVALSRYGLVSARALWIARNR